MPDAGVEGRGRGQAAGRRVVPRSAVGAVRRGWFRETNERGYMPTINQLIRNPRRGVVKKSKVRDLGRSPQK